MKGRIGLKTENTTECRRLNTRKYTSTATFQKLQKCTAVFFLLFFSELQFYLRFVDTVVVFCSANLLRFVIKPDLLKVVFSVA